MSLRLRLRLAAPLIGLSMLMAGPAYYGTIAWWSEYGVTYQVLSVIICLVVTVQLGVAVSIAVRPVKDVPWLRIGLVCLGILVTCGLARLRGEF